MNNYEIVLFIIAILAVCFVLYLLCRLLVSYSKRNRLSDFGIEINNNPDIGVGLRYKFLYKFANILESLVIFNGIARTYDKFIDENSKLRKGIDYIAIKITIGFILVLLYIFMSMLYINKLNLVVGIVCFILGYILPDFFCYYKQFNREEIVTKDLLGAIIIIRNSYKANRSVEVMLNDVIKRTNGRVKDEFKKVLSDVKVGLSVSESFKRMYYRTGITFILDIANMLSLTNKASINVIEVFDSIEKKIIEYEKLDNEVQMLKSINKLAYFIFLTLPFIFIVFIIISNQSYLALIGTNAGFAIMLSLIFIYLLYIFIINKIVKGRYL